MVPETSLNFQFNNSDVNTRYGLGYSNPYFTDDGIGARMIFFTERPMPKMPIWRFLKQKNLVQLLRYLSLLLSIIRLGTSFGYTNTEIILSAGTSSQITNFINSNGSQYDILKFNVNFAYDTRNKAILPDKGAFQRINAVIADAEFR